MTYDNFLEYINGIDVLNEKNYSVITNKFKEKTNTYFNKFIDSLGQNEYIKNLPKFEFYLNISTFHSSINRKYLDPNLNIYYNDISKYPILSVDDEKIIINKLFKLKKILNKKLINDEYINNLLIHYKYNKEIDADLESRRKQLKFLKKIQNKNMNKHIRRIELFVLYLDLKEQFINSNLRLVVSFLKNKKIKTCDLLDYIQWGNEGVLYAFEKFDPRYNTKFSTYAYFWINCKINAGLFKERKKVKVSYGMYLLAKHYNNFIQKYYRVYGVCPTLDEKVDFIYNELYANKDSASIEKHKNMCKVKITYIENILKYENASSLDILIGDDLDNSIIDMIIDTQTDVEKEALNFDLQDKFKFVFSNIVDISNKQICIILLRNGVGINNYLNFKEVQNVFKNQSFEMQYKIWKSKKIYTLQEIGDLLNVSRQNINVQELKIKKKIKEYKSMFDGYMD